jgi:UPF0271 protein
MKLNCDMGESFGAWKMGADAEIMPYVDMSNIACGFHASDPQVMNHTVTFAVHHNVAIGAHPGYPDLAGFGRKEMAFSEEELVNIVLYQVGALQAICRAHHTTVDYVKPHGALYNTMMRDRSVYKALLKAVAALSPALSPTISPALSSTLSPALSSTLSPALSSTLSPTLSSTLSPTTAPSIIAPTIPLMIMATPDHLEYKKMADEYGVTLLLEAFCDRAYTDEGLLQSRKIDGAVYQNIDTIISQAKKLIIERTVTTCTGNSLSINADTLCIHGDGALALESVQRIRELLTPPSPQS